MKKLLLFVCLISSMAVKSQDTVNVIIEGKNIVHYKSDLISESLIQDKDYIPGVNNQKVIYDRAIGIDVDIYVDTIFKRYTVSFTDQEGRSKIMNYRYVGDAFPKEKNEEPKKGDPKLYLMESKGTYFLLSDFMDVFWSHELEITYNNTLPNNRTLLFTIKKVKKVIK